MTDIISLIFSNYNILITMVAIILLIWGIYNKIKFLCLKKASELVSNVEEETDLTGSEKFALVLLWITEELPSVFRNSLFKSTIEELIEFAYTNSFSYMQKYIERKTGYDVTSLLNIMKNQLSGDNDKFEDEKKQDGDEVW